MQNSIRPKTQRRTTFSMPGLRAGELNHVLVHQFATRLSSKRCSFLGSDPEPRHDLSSGHVPHSISLPFTAFLENHNIPEGVASKIGGDLPVTYTRLRSTQGMFLALQEALGPERTKEVLKGKRRVVTSCGSGMTAGVLWLGLKLLGVEGVGIYDEVRLALCSGRVGLIIRDQSWTGYAMRPGSKIVKGG